MNEQPEEKQSIPGEVELFVAWCDVMGARSAMLRDPGRAMYMVGQFHDCALHVLERHESIKVLPFNDGAFILGREWEVFRAAIVDLFVFNTNAVRMKAVVKRLPHLAYLIRCAIAYGAVGLGSNANLRWSGDFDRTASYRQSLIVGTPVALAYTSEACAAPQGIYLHESAVKAAGLRSSFDFVWAYPSDFDRFQDFVVPYFEYQDRHADEIGYSAERSPKYVEMAKDYFSAAK